MGRISNGLKPTMMMVTVQISMAGLNVFYKLAANDGMSSRVLVAYCFMLAAATFVPLALYIERKNRPKLTWMVLWEAFLSALFGGSIAKNLYVQSVALTSATLVSAIINLTSAVTFVMAIFFGMERLSLGTMAGKAKIVGTLLSIGGAMLLTFYKGIEMNMWSIHVDLFHGSQYHDRHVESSHRKSIDQILGPLVALASCFSYSFSLIIQTKVNKRYPCYYSSTALISVMGALQAIVFALCTERDWSQWKLGWNIRLLTVVYSGTIGSGLIAMFTMLCLSMRGPLFVSAFTPLVLVLVAIVGSLLLNEKLHLGSVLGSIIIVCGLYAVLWGKSKEIENIAQLMPLKCPRETEEIDAVVASRVENNKSSNITGIASNFPPKIDNFDALDCVEEEQEEEEEGVFNVKV